MKGGTGTNRREVYLLTERWKEAQVAAGGRFIFSLKGERRHRYQQEGGLFSHRKVKGGTGTSRREVYLLTERWKEAQVLHVWKTGGSNIYTSQCQVQEGGLPSHQHAQTSIISQFGGWWSKFIKTFRVTGTSGSVNLSDVMSDRYNVNCKTCNCSKKPLFHLLDLTLVNTFIIQKMHDP